MKIDRNYLRFLYKLLLVVIAVAALMSPALINGFPLVYSDTGTYIAAAKTQSIPVDRPIGYSLFLNITSFNISIWFTIIIQCAVMYYLVLLLFKDVFNKSNSYEFSSGAIVLLSFTTGISNYSSQLMPDIFVSWMILIVFIFLFRRNSTIQSNIILSILFIISVISHFSVLLAATVIILLMVVLNIIYKWESKYKAYFLLILIIAGWLTIPIINFSYGAGFSISRCKNVAIMGRLVETGIVSEFLNENCKQNKYPLCQYKDSLPTLSYVFLWEESSPLYKGNCLPTGWGNCWIEKDHEYSMLIRDIVTTPKYQKKLVATIVKATYDQSIDFKIGVLVPMKEISAPYGTIKTFYPHDFEAYTKAGQFNRILYFNLISSIQKWLVILSLLIIPVMMFFLRKNKDRIYVLIKFTIIIVVGLITNAAICSCFSTVVDRYQSRVIWLIPLLLISTVVVLWPSRKTI